MKKLWKKRLRIELKHIRPKRQSRIHLRKCWQNMEKKGNLEIARIELDETVDYCNFESLWFVWQIAKDSTRCREYIAIK